MTIAAKINTIEEARAQIAEWREEYRKTKDRSLRFNAGTLGMKFGIKPEVDAAFDEADKVRGADFYDRLDKLTTKQPAQQVEASDVEIVSPPIAPAPQAPVLRRKQFGEPPPERAEKSEVEDDGPSEIGEAQNLSGADIPQGEEWKARILTESPILVRAAPMDNAKAFAHDRLWLWNSDEAMLGTYFYHGEWYQFNGSFFERAPTQRISDVIYNYLDLAKERSGDETRRFRPKPEHANQLLKCLEPCVGIDDRDIPPMWFDGREEPPAQNLIAFKNCLLDVVTGKTYRVSPELWLQEGVGFDYDPEARCPRWDRFLCEMFPDDPDARMTIEEHLGLGMTRDGQFEKAAMWIGETRSGRGTLAYIQELLVGPNGHVPLDIHTWNSTENSKQELIGKRVGIFHDVRLKEAKTYGTVSFDPGGVEYKSMQALLEIIARDAQRWGRKYLEAWRGRPYIKIIFISNQMPNLNDNALLGRFILLDFAISFADRVDTELKDKKLPAELPGIANRCLAGYRRLLERKGFVQPQSGLALLERLKGKINPFVAFMSCWEMDIAGPGVVVKDFETDFKLWCANSGRTDLIKLAGTSNLIRKINELPEWKHLHSFQPHGEKRRYPLKDKVRG